MRPAFYLPDFNGGGAERALLLFARHWPEPGERPLLVTRARSGSLRDVFSDVEHVCLDLPASGPAATLSTARRLRAVLEQHGVTHLVAALSLPSMALLKVLMPSLVLAYTVQTTPETAAVDARALPVRQRAAVRARSVVVAAALSRVDVLLLPVEGMRSALPRAAQDRVRVLPNPVVLAPWPAPPSQDGRAPVVWVGRLSPEKRPDLLVAVAAQLPQGVAVDVFGRGPLEEWADSAARDAGADVRFRGFENDHAAVYAGREVLLVTSDYEGFGNVLVEALSYGCSVVSTDAPFGPPEILEGGGDLGALVPRGDAAQLASAVVRVLSARAERPELREVSRRRAEGYAVELVVERLRELLLAQPPRAAGSSHG